MRPFCWACHRPLGLCFCNLVRSFQSPVEFALVVHPFEVKSTVGTAWILRKSISNLHWIRSNGKDLDESPQLSALLANENFAPLLLFPGTQSKPATNLSQATDVDWMKIVPESKRPLIIVLDGTWIQARSMLAKCARLRALPRISFSTDKPSEYGFKRQPHPACLSSVEGVHLVLDILSERAWVAAPRIVSHDHPAHAPASRPHDQMIEIFRRMVLLQLAQESHGNVRRVDRSSPTLA